MYVFLIENKEFINLEVVPHLRCNPILTQPG